MSRRCPAPDSPLRKVGGGAGRPRPRPAPSSLGSGRLARRPPGTAPLGHKAEAKGRLVHLALSGAGWPSSRRPQAFSGKDHSPTLTAPKRWGGKVKVTVLGSPALRFLALERSPALALRCLLGPTSWGGGSEDPIQMACSQGLDPFGVWAGLDSPGAAPGREVVLRGVCCPPRSCLFQAMWGL